MNRFLTARMILDEDAFLQKCRIFGKEIISAGDYEATSAQEEGEKREISEAKHVIDECFSMVKETCAEYPPLVGQWSEEGRLIW